MKKSLFILPVLLLSAAQIEAMRYNNIQSSVLDKLPDERKTEEVSFNISNMDEDTLHWLSMVLDKLPDERKTKDILMNITKMNKDTLYWLSMVLDKLPDERKTEDILMNITKMNKYALQNLNNSL